tara:strand:+ start:611 stop:1804 length:1194 start_codon:yes stop_codon:yes gene_type:complete
MNNIKFNDFQRLTFKAYCFFYLGFFLIYIYYSYLDYEYPYGFFLYSPSERFSDLFLQLNIFDLNNPYSFALPQENFPYFPGSIIFFKIFKLFGSNYYALSYLILSLVVLAVCVWKILKKYTNFQKFYVFLLFLLSPPYLYALDRGNTDSFLIPLLIYCVLSKKQSIITMLLWVFIGSFKPQYLFGLFFTKEFDSYKIFQTIFIFISLNFTYLIFFTNNDIFDLINSTLLISNWVNIGLKPSLFPINDYIGFYLKNSSIYPLVLALFDFLKTELGLLSEEFFITLLNIFKILFNLLILFFALRIKKFDANIIMFTISFMSITFWAGTYRSIIFFMVLLFYLTNDLPKPIFAASLIYQLQFLVIGLMPFNYMFSILMALLKFSVFLYIIYILRKEKLLI